MCLKGYVKTQKREVGKTVSGRWLWASRLDDGAEIERLTTLPGEHEHDVGHACLTCRRTWLTRNVVLGVDAVDACTLCRSRASVVVGFVFRVS
jgi:hypothetical protein